MTNPYVLVVALLLLIGSFFLGEHQQYQEDQGAIQKLVADSAKAKLDAEAQLRKVQDETTADLAANHESYQEQIALLNRSNAQHEADLRAGSDQLRVAVIALGKANAVDPAAGPIGDPSPAYALSPSVAADLDRYCVGEYNTLREQLVGVIADYKTLAAKFNGASQ